SDDTYKETGIETIAGGAIPELFRERLLSVIANIDDLNCEAKAKREITVKVTFEPDATRQMVAVKVSLGSKLAAPKKAEGAVFLVHKRNGELIAVENNVHQPELF